MKSGDCRSRKYVGTCTQTLSPLDSSCLAHEEGGQSVCEVIASGNGQVQADGCSHLLRHQLALVHDGVRRQRADVGVLVVVALPVPFMRNQLPQDVELHFSKPPQGMHRWRMQHV